MLLESHSRQMAKERLRERERLPVDVPAVVDSLPGRSADELAGQMAQGSSDDLRETLKTQVL